MSKVNTDIWIPSETGNGYVNSAISGIEVSGTIKELYEAGKLTQDGKWDPSNIWCGTKGISILHSLSSSGAKESVNIIVNNNLKKEDGESSFTYSGKSNSSPDFISKIRLAVITEPNKLPAYRMEPQTITWIGGGSEGPFYTGSDETYFDNRNLMNAYIVSKFNPQKFCFFPQIQVVEEDYSNPLDFKSYTQQFNISDLTPNSENPAYKTSILNGLNEKGYYDDIANKKRYRISGFLLETYSEQGIDSLLRSRLSDGFALAPVVEHTSSGAVFYTLPCFAGTVYTLTIYGTQRGNYYFWNKIQDNSSENFTTEITIGQDPNYNSKYSVYGCGVKINDAGIVDYNIPSTGMGKIKGFNLSSKQGAPEGTLGILTDNGDTKQYCGYSYSILPTGSEQYGTGYRIAPFYSINAIKRMLAGLCCYWADNYKAASGAELGPNCTDPAIHIGVMDEDGNNDGTYISGVEIADSDIGNIDDSEDSTFDPSKIPDVNLDPDYTGDYIDGLVPNSGTASPGLVNYYIGNLEAVKVFGDRLWSAPKDFWDALTLYKDMAVDPFNFIVSLRTYPFNLGGDTATQDIWVGSGGKISIERNFYRAESNYKELDFGKIEVKPEYGNFLDYDPYTKVYINLPFSGVWELNTRQVMGGILTVTCTVDLTDGSGIWLVRNTDTGKNLLMKQCRIGADIPLTGNASAQIASNIVNASLSAITTSANSFTNIAGVIGQAATGNWAGAGLGAVSTGANALTSNIAASANVAHASADIPHITGGTTGVASFLFNHTVFLLYSRPTELNPNNYGHTVGHLVNREGTIENQEGFTICNNVDTSGIAATESERDLIKQILESGFYA